MAGSASSQSAPEITKEGFSAIDRATLPTARDTAWLTFLVYSCYGFSEQAMMVVDRNRTSQVRWRHVGIDDGMAGSFIYIYIYTLCMYI